MRSQAVGLAAVELNAELVELLEAVVVARRNGNLLHLLKILTKNWTPT